MNSTTKEVKFMKWEDPLLAGLANNTSEDEDEEWNENKADKATKVSGPFLVGPIGIIPINEGNVPSKLFNFWMMHTNFSITPKLIDKMEAVNGVETLDVWTRYRARIGIGKIFDETEVLNDIEKELCSEEKDSIDILKKDLKSKYKFWAIVVSDNKVIPFVGKSKEEVEGKVSSFKTEQILRSWE